MSWKPIVVAAGIILAAFVAWELRSLALPLMVSGLLAYVCRPLVTGLERRHVRRGLGIGLVLAGFLSACLVIVIEAQVLVPTEHKAAELKVHALSVIHQRYMALMGLDHSPTNGNRLYRLIRDDADQLMDRIHEMLALTPEEHAEFLASHAKTAGLDPASDRLLSEHRSNVESERRPGRKLPPNPSAVQVPAPGRTAIMRSPVSTLGDAVSTWICAPLVFFFLLRDTGEVKRGFLGLVPNRFFEPALAILADLDRAVGNYLRGLALSCSLLGVTVMVLFAVIGVPVRWSFAIGFVAAVTNVVPYLGSVVALLGGLAYAFFGEDFQPVLPMLGRDSLALWVVVAVGVADVMKNVVYDPLVLGGAVRLHPLVVIVGFMGGTLMFGVVGAVLAIPTITIFIVFVSSASKHLHAYGVV
jgi:predicted PurR-regulated permease PerM